MEKKAEVIERLTGEMLKCHKARSVWNMPFKTPLCFLVPGEWREVIRCNYKGLLFKTVKLYFKCILFRFH